MKHIFLSLLVGLALPSLALAQEFTDERRAQFVEIMSKHDCRFHNQEPSQDLLDELFAADFDRDEIRMIGRNLIETGDGVVEGQTLVARIGPCSP